MNLKQTLRDIEVNQNISTFYNMLYDEKLKHKEHRHEFVKQKLIFIIGLFSIGSLNAPGKIDLSVLLYFIPFVALAYDIYIFSEDFKIKRIGVFIRTMMVNENSWDFKWENWLNDISERRESIAIYASMGLTVLILISSSYLLKPETTNNGFFLYIWWFAVSVTLCILVFGFAIYRRSQLLKQ